MEKPLKTAPIVTKGLTENQEKCIRNCTHALVTSSDEKIKASAWRSIISILDYIKK